MIPRHFILVSFIICLVSSCVIVKGYEKVAISDPDMKLSDTPCDQNVTVAHTYREAASGAGGGKMGGGCGCN